MIRQWNRSALIFCLTLLPCVKSLVHSIWAIEPDNSAVGQRCCCGHMYVLCVKQIMLIEPPNKCQCSNSEAHDLGLKQGRIKHHYPFYIVRDDLLCAQVRNYDIQITSVMVYIHLKKNTNAPTWRDLLYVTFIGCLSLNL